MILDQLMSLRAEKIVGGKLTDEGLNALFGLGGQDNVAGESVTEDTALNESAYFCGVNIIANAFRSLPLNVYDRHSDGSRVLAESAPAYRILKRRPNSEMKISTWKWFTLYCMIVWGNAYSEIERDRSGRPINLWPIHPRSIKLVRDAEGRLVYKLTSVRAGKLDSVLAQNVFHTFLFTRDGLTGISALKACADPVGIARATNRSAGKFFKSGAMPRGVLKHPGTGRGKLSDQAVSVLRNDWDRIYGGTENFHKVLILREGMDYEKMGMPAEEAQMLESRKFGIEEFARILNLPPHKLKDYGRATWNNVEQMKIEYVEDSLLPWATEIEGEADIKLIGASGRYAKFNMNALLRGDSKQRSDYYGRMAELSVFTPNDILEREDLDGFDGGDVRLVSANLKRLEDLGAEGEEEDFMQMLALAFADLSKRAGQRIRRAAGRVHNDFPSWWAGFIDSHQELAEDRLTPILRRMGVEPAQKIENYLADLQRLYDNTFADKPHLDGRKALAESVNEYQTSCIERWCRDCLDDKSPINHV